MITQEAITRTEKAQFPTLASEVTSPDIYRSVDSAARSVFAEPGREVKLARARQVLGELATGLSDEQVETFLTELQCFINYWLDEYEQQVFGGLTLKEVLRSANE